MRFPSTPRAAQVTSVIVRQASRSYWRGMARLAHLLLFLAVLMMPFGMAAAPAMAAQHEVTSQDHCDGYEEPADAPAHASDHCATCSALPAVDLPAPVAAALPRSAVAPLVLAPFAGIVPEIATPPPKLS